MSATSTWLRSSETCCGSESSIVTGRLTGSTVIGRRDWAGLHTAGRALAGASLYLHGERAILGTRNWRKRRSLSKMLFSMKGSRIGEICAYWKVSRLADLGAMDPLELD